MGIRTTDLHCKEVVCVNDGCRLGFVSDVEVEIPGGQVCALVVPGKGRFFGLWGRTEDYVIPWRSICRIGDDIVLVDCKLSDCRVPRQHPGWFA